MSWRLRVALVAVAAVGIGAVRQHYLVVTVIGSSMGAAYHDGDRVLVRRVAPGSLRRGQVVVLQAPPHDLRWERASRPRVSRGTWQIKRIAAAPGDPLPGSAAVACRQPAGTPIPPGQLVVFGDAQTSYDSRAWGFLPAERVLGVALRRLSSGAGTGRSPVTIGHQVGSASATPHGKLGSRSATTGPRSTWSASPRSARRRRDRTTERTR